MASRGAYLRHTDAAEKREFQIRQTVEPWARRALGRRVKGPVSLRLVVSEDLGTKTERVSPPMLGMDVAAKLTDILTTTAGSLFDEYEGGTFRVSGTRALKFEFTYWEPVPGLRMTEPAAHVVGTVTVIEPMPVEDDPKDDYTWGASDE